MRRSDAAAAARRGRADRRQRHSAGAAAGRHSPPAHGLGARHEPGREARPGPGGGARRALRVSRRRRLSGRRLDRAGRSSGSRTRRSPRSAGPGVTPPGSGWRERAGGAFYESPFGSGGLRFRFTPLGAPRDVDDFPAYNLFVRTDELRAIGGWDSSFYGGEDTKVCLALRRAGHRIVYDPRGARLSPSPAGLRAPLAPGGKRRPAPRPLRAHPSRDIPPAALLRPGPRADRRARGGRLVGAKASSRSRSGCARDRGCGDDDGLGAPRRPATPPSRSCCRPWSPRHMPRTASPSCADWRRRRSNGCDDAPRRQRRHPDPERREVPRRVSRGARRPGLSRRARRDPPRRRGLDRPHARDRRAPTASIGCSPIRLRTGEAGKAVGVRAARQICCCMVDSDNVVVGRDWLRRMVAPVRGRGDHLVRGVALGLPPAGPLHQPLPGSDRDQRSAGALHRQLRPLVGADGSLDGLPVPLRATRRLGARRARSAVRADDGRQRLHRAAAGARRRPRRRLLLRHRLRLRPRAARRADHRARRRPGAALLLRLGAPLLPEDPPAHRRLPLLRAHRPPQLSVDRAAAASGSCGSSSRPCSSSRCSSRCSEAGGASPTRAWLFHVPACWITLGVYAAGYLRGRFAPKMLDREGWSQ